MAVGVLAARWFASQSGRALGGREFARRALVINAWLYFGLNQAMFRFPWPWTGWTARTPNAIAFTICVLGLTLACLMVGRQPRDCRSTRTAG